MNAHTPGPWTVDDHLSSSCCVGTVDEKGRAVCNISQSKVIFHKRKRPEFVMDDEDRANARLIAAAPDLLAELKWVAGRIDRQSGSPNFTSDEYDRIVAAIAKAEGRS